MRVYEAIVKGLESVGVEAAFGGAGENAAGLMLALKDSETIRPIITRHEQAASFMACGYAMYTDKLGFCFATAGPGAFNLFSGLAVAMSDSYPMLAVSGYAPMEWKGRGLAQRDLGLEPDPELAGHVRRDDEGVVPGHPDRGHLRHPRGSREPRLRRASRPGAHHGAREPHPSRGGAWRTTTTSALDVAARRCRSATRSSAAAEALADAAPARQEGRHPGRASAPSAATQRQRSSGSSSASRSRC